MPHRWGGAFRAWIYHELAMLLYGVTLSLGQSLPIREHKICVTYTAPCKGFLVTQTLQFHLHTLVELKFSSFSPANLTDHHFAYYLASEKSKGALESNSQPFRMLWNYWTLPRSSHSLSVISPLWLLGIYIGKNLFAFTFANKERFAFAEIFSQWFECNLYIGDSDWAIPNEFKPVHLKCLRCWHQLDYFCLFCDSDTVWQNKPELTFFSVQNYKSLSLQSVRMEEKLQLEQWKCTSICKFEDTVARNCASSISRNSSRISRISDR